jgi:hypothetical protein
MGTEPEPEPEPCVLAALAQRQGLALPAPGTGSAAAVSFTGVLLRKRVTSANTAFLSCRGSPDGHDTAGAAQLVLRTPELKQQARSVAKNLPLDCTLNADGVLYRTKHGQVSVLVHRVSGALGAGLGATDRSPPAVVPTTVVPLCRAFARTGVCLNYGRGKCRFSHAPPTPTEARAAAAAVAKSKSHLEAEAHPDDPWSDDQKACKPHRAKVFATWLVETFALSSGSRVLDVAGGKGDVSIELAQHGVACTVVEPNLRQPAKRRAAMGAGACAQAAPAVQWREAMFVGDETDLPAHDLIIGLHPDQATEPIVDAALRTGMPFAVVPCCVFASECPRTLRTEGGRDMPVVAYGAFVEYLQQKATVAGRFCNLAFLPVRGKNRVLYAHAP